MAQTGKPPLVSVVIPAYNAGDTLLLAIRSALAQTYPHVEVVLVNDGSTTASTRDIALGFGDRITYVERPNGGVAAARNTEIGRAHV